MLWLHRKLRTTSFCSTPTVLPTSDYFPERYQATKEGADRLLSAELGNFAGLLAAAIVVFFLAPLQHLAERVAGVAMPKTQNTPEYAAFRKMQVYEAAVAEAQQGGGISQKERALLDRLRDSLEVSTSDAEAIEVQLQARLTE